MPYFPKLNINFVSIPSNAGITICQVLLKHELFNGQDQEEDVYDSIIFQNKYVAKNSDFENIHSGSLYYRYPQAPEAVMFSVVRNPFTRMVSLFYDLTYSQGDFHHLRLSLTDNKTDIQNKFLNFILLFKDIKNMQAGIGLANLEAMTEALNFPDRDKLIRFIPSRYTDTRYHPQHSFFFKDWMNNIHYLNKNPEKKKINFLRYERVDEDLKSIFPKLFENKLKYITYSKKIFDVETKSFKSLPKIDYVDFYNEKSLFYVREIYEEDFFRFHYSPDAVSK